MSKGKRIARKRRAGASTIVLAVLLLAVVVLGAMAARMAIGEFRNKADAEEPSAPVWQEPETPASGPDDGDKTTAPAAEDNEAAHPSVASPEEPDAKPEESAPQYTASRAESVLAGMSEREKVCQLFIVFPSQITGVGTVTAAGEATRKALETYPVGGMIYDRSNLVSQEQVRKMLHKTQEYARVPLILTCDEEGGRVNRLMSTVGTTYIGPMLSYSDQGTEQAAENARTIASDLLSCGFNTDLAPVADVWSNKKNTVIGDRAYSTDYSEAAELVAAAVEGFHRGGAACTLKHFPGHGDTSADSHYGSVYVYKSMEKIRAEELQPFRAGIAAGADAVMMGHLIISDVSDEPALFSHELVTDVLRGELGFDGVVMTDSLQMQAMTDHYGSGEIAVKAIKAGVDVLLCPADLDKAINALLRAVETGELTQERIDESVLRVLRLKEARGIL